MEWRTFAEILVAAGFFLRELARVIEAVKGKGPRSAQDRGGH